MACVVVLSSPMLAQIAWTWACADPDHWSEEESNDGGATWSEVNVLPGSQRSDGGLDSGNWYRVTGQDALNNPVTNVSNIVVCM
jgi:hypothetical protein